MGVFNIHIEVPSKASSSFEFSLTFSKQDVKSYPIKITLSACCYEDIFSVKYLSPGSMGLIKRKLIELQETNNMITDLDITFLLDWFKNKENADSILNNLSNDQNVVLTFIKYIK